METISVLNENKTQSDIAFETVTKWGNYQKLIKEELILNEISKKYIINLTHMIYYHS